MIEMKLSDIQKVVGGTLYGDGNTVIKGICTDSRVYSENELFIALKGEKFDGNDFVEKLSEKCNAFLTNKKFCGINHIVVEDTLASFGKLAAFWKSNVSPKYTVGVTGSVGKTTTKELISSVLRTKYKTHSTTGNFNNNIGVPITLVRIEKGTEAVVCEMGMSTRGEISYLTSLVKPNLAVITNIGTSHIENLGSREEICRAKLEILEGLSENGTVILDGDEALFKTEWAKELIGNRNMVFVGFGDKNDIYPLDIYKGADHISFDAITPKGEMRIKVPAIGDHFIKNALFAVAAGIACDIDAESVKEGILNYSPSGLRQKIYTVGGIKVIADCYNASPESMKASLSVLRETASGRKIAVLGDMLELGSITEEAHREVGRLLVENKIDEAFTYGKAAWHIMKGAVDLGFDKEKIHNFIDRDEASSEISKFIKAGDTVLFKASRRMKLEEIIAHCGLTE